MKSTQKKIDDITEKYQVKLGELSYKLNDTETELKEVQDLIKEETYITEGKKIYIVRNDKTIRGKVHYRNKMRWFHIGQTKKLKGKTDDELKKMVRDKFYKSLITIPEPKQVSIPLMMTNKMRTELKKIGFSEKEIKGMTPQEGWDNINKGSK